MKASLIHLNTKHQYPRRAVLGHEDHRAEARDQVQAGPEERILRHGRQEDQHPLQLPRLPPGELSLADHNAHL